MRCKGKCVCDYLLALACTLRGITKQRTAGCVLLSAVAAAHGGGVLSQVLAASRAISLGVAPEVSFRYVLPHVEFGSPIEEG